MVETSCGSCPRPQELIPPYPPARDLLGHFSIDTQIRIPTHVSQFPLSKTYPRDPQHKLIQATTCFHRS
ncbi:hypothetical protein PROFUN_11225 [Planoprotostelium fungivorum]|uniref:Uncharacterized protein n=1 Tax=Planoprotostelium fungivorum TaxID=1890364 RepID=A0A2P6NA41_9EUKA|nr:hypothetical protein PROFUN_11225 [Planoprotostelium fungivorum]